jgi:ubiquinone biosynthesis monooxygenase Coq7
MRAPLSILDRLIVQVDQAMKSVVGGTSTRTRRSPAENVEKSILSQREKARAVKLMRVNHSGEVCAQALYQGQALAAKSAELEQTMYQASREEIDHLAWCEARIKELDGHTSFLNPLWYIASFTTGVAAGFVGDRYNLGFLAATEDLVSEHLEDYIERLPNADLEGQAILTQMRLDERRHATTAREAGAIEFSPVVKGLMRAISKIMTLSTYRI